MRLAFHHHDEVFQDADGQLWLSAGIGRWLNELARYVDTLVLLMPSSSIKTAKQDTRVSAENIQWLSLGLKGRYWDYLQKKRRVRRVCKSISGEVDALLIRGMTPLQKPVWSYVNAPHRAFLLVRSPRQRRIINLSPISWIAAWANYVRERDYQKISKTAEVLLTNSPQIMREMEAASEREVFLAPTNIIQDAEISTPQPRDWSSSLRVLFVGRIHYLKGLRELIAALSALHKLGVDAALDVVGDNNNRAYEELVNLSHDHHVASHIYWHGRVPFGEELLHFYDRAHVLILPTYTEGFPRVLWEAASRGCPMIVSNVGGIPMFLKDRVHALLIKPQSVSAIVEAFIELSRDPDLRHRMTNNASLLARCNSVESCAAKMVDRLRTEWSL